MAAGRPSSLRACAAREGIVSVYARGRDYHKVLRARLQKLSDRIAEAVGPFGHRVFTDSAPVLEAELAARSGQGWRGKHTLVLNREAARCSFWARSTWTWHLPPPSPSRALRQLQRLHRRVPHAGHHGAAPAGCAALHLVPDHRARRAIPKSCAR
jgi:epoxyqueuosine reductase QueG